MDFLTNQKRFSFKLDGVSCWELPYHKEITEKGNEVISVYTFENGLKITNIAKKYEKFGAYEWVNYWENTSQKPTGKITELFDSDCAIDFPQEKPTGYPWEPALPDMKKATKIHAPFGSSIGWQEFYSDADEIAYNLPTYHLYPKGSSLLEHLALEFHNEGGRSSNGHAPFFNIQKEDRGVIVAIGWSGQWLARFERDETHLYIKTKIQDTAFIMLPNEKFRTSSVVILPYVGDEFDGQNKWRRLVKEYFNIIGENGREKHGPFSLDCWGGESSESVLRKIEAEKQEEIHADYLWMDAGWFGIHTRPTEGDFGVEEWVWHKQVGDWRVSPYVHPNGLQDVAKAVKDANMKFLLWFESERCVKTAPMASEHPEYFLSVQGDNNLLLNLGDERAWEYIFQSLCDTIEKLDIRCCRQDFNMDPLVYWQTNDEQDRIGINEIKYINGLYRLWDRLLERFPNMIIDNCASGGRRIDIETMRRSIPLWRSDSQCKEGIPVEIWQNHHLHYNAWLPYSGTITWFISPSGKRDLYLARSSYSTASNFGGFAGGKENDDKNEGNTKQSWLDERKREYLWIRDYFSEDFYPLTQSSPKKDIWCAAQFNRPEKGDGIVQIFRREDAPYESANFVLRGLKDDTMYAFTDVDSGETVLLNSKDIKEKGWSVTISQKRSAKIYKYTEMRV